uniref:Uncharacterized protein n=1 Tax=Vespula pensylvanica TaxID=30213 RepID=A0A834P7I5_VESPE|nr:hypothetical protein H0235_006364 [Vespula pensylvanica]
MPRGWFGSVWIVGRRSGMGSGPFFFSALPQPAPSASHQLNFVPGIFNLFRFSLKIRSALALDWHISIHMRVGHITYVITRSSHYDGKGCGDNAVVVETWV